MISISYAELAAKAPTNGAAMLAANAAVQAEITANGATGPTYWSLAEELAKQIALCCKEAGIGDCGLGRSFGI